MRILQYVVFIMQNTNQTQLEFPIVMGQPYEIIPDDLFIPPNALELCLETFSGPMDLLLYLIKKENINILELDVSNITDQYIEYIDLMDSLQFELAAEYLVMAATLAEIKSRLMLPQENYDEEEEDPRATLIKRLQEYQRYKSASENIALLPRVDRDFFTASAGLPEIKLDKQEITVSKEELATIFHEIQTRPDLKLHHQIDFEELSTQERIQIILQILSKKNIVSFSKTLRKGEGRHGVVVTFLASLELAKDGHIELIQNKTEEIFLKSLTGVSN
jgi:segregation and condensation protein A